MKNTLKIEELAMFLLSIFAFQYLPFSWWWYVGLYLLPDIGFLGYLINNKIGAISYNLLHHKGIAILLYCLGFYLENDILKFIGTLLFGHASFDRIAGYGLKYFSSFNETHLGKIGKNRT